MDTKAALKDRLKLAVQARDALGNLVMRANVRTDEDAVIAMALCLTIQELFASVILLTDNGLASHAPSHVRTMRRRSDQPQVIRAIFRRSWHAAGGGRQDERVEREGPTSF